MPRLPINNPSTAQKYNNVRQRRRHTQHLYLKTKSNSYKAPSENSSSTPALSTTQLMLHHQRNRGRPPYRHTLIHFLNYAASQASHPYAEILYKASDKILCIASDVAYVVTPQARRRAGGFHYLSNHDDILFNGPIHILAKVIKKVMASPPKQRSPPSTSTPKKLFPSAPHSSNPVTHNQQLRSKPITAPPPELSTAPSNKNVPKPSTCVSTGSRTEPNKDNSKSTGPLANKI